MSRRRHPIRTFHGLFTGTACNDCHCGAQRDSILLAALGFPNAPSVCCSRSPHRCNCSACAKKYGSVARDCLVKYGCEKGGPTGKQAPGRAGEPADELMCGRARVLVSEQAGERAQGSQAEGQAARQAGSRQTCRQAGTSCSVSHPATASPTSPASSASYTFLRFVCFLMLPLLPLRPVFPAAPARSAAAAASPALPTALSSLVVVSSPVVFVFRCGGAVVWPSFPMIAGTPEPQFCTLIGYFTLSWMATVV